MKLTEPMMRSLHRTAGWVKLFSILTYIGFWMMVLAAAGSAIAAVVLGLEDPSAFALFIGTAGFALLAVLVRYPAVRLWRFAQHSAACETSGNAGDLLRAQQEMHRYWRYVGIVTISYIGLVIVAVFAAIILVAVGAALGGAFAR